MNAPDYTSRPERSRRRAPRWLLLAIAVLLLGGAGVGTYASFSASTSNNATFATGSLVLSNSVNGAAACLSDIGGVTDENINANCDAVFSLSVRKPGDAATANIDLVNTGTLDAAVFKVHTGAACAAANASGESYHGTGNPCASVRFWIQEFTTAGRTVAQQCWYGGNEGAGNTCSYSGTRTLAHFSTTYPDWSTGIGLGTFTSGATRYFRVGVELDSAAGNSLQGRAANLDLSWRMEL
jgi:predicted ribosomally synthesized peptide with SipW-like signal peptide